MTMGPSVSSQDPPDEKVGERLEVRLQRMRLERSLFGRATEITVGRYTLDEPLGVGGMGVVYRANDQSLDRPVALKVLNEQRAAHPDASARMVREARAMAKLSHPHVLTVHEVGVEDGQPYIAMELMPGGTLLDWIQQHPPGSPRRDEAAVELLRQCTDGLLAAHEAGLVHRDFKPHNVLLTARGVAKVADFGLVRVSGDASESMDSRASDTFSGLDEGRALTVDGSAVGTPRYMAPEQARGTADARSDQYSLCKTFLEVFEGSPGPRGLEALLRRGSSDAPEDRFEDLQALRTQLDALTRPRRRVALWGALAVAGLGLSTLALWTRAPQEIPVEACDDGRGQLEGVWDEARRSEIRDAFERSEVSSWRAAWAAVEMRLDEWTDAWSAARLDACEATRLRRVQDDRMMAMRLACLDQRLVAVRVLSDAYALADRDTVVDALTTSHALPRVESCADREQLEYGSAGRGLDDPELRAAYDRVGEADAHRNLGREDEAIALYEALTPELQRLEVPSLLSHVELWHGSLVLTQGDYELADTLVRRALSHAEQGGRDLDISRAWVRMSEVARLRDDLDASELFLERAENIALRHPDAPRFQGEVARSRGDLESARGNPTAALEAMDRALSLLDELGSSQLARFQIEHQTLGVLTLLGRDDEMERRARSLLERAHEMFGPENYRTTMVAGAYAQMFVRRGDWSTARALTRAAPTLSMSSQRADLVVDLRIMHAISLQGLGLYEQAVRVLEDSIAEGTPILGPEHGQILNSRLQLVVMQIEQEQYADALEVLRAMADQVGALHPMSQCGFWVNSALAESGSGEREAAAATMDRALETCRAHAAAKSVWLFTALRYGGEVYEQAEQRDKARACWVEAREIADTVQVAPPELAVVDEGLARLSP